MIPFITSRTSTERLLPPGYPAEYSKVVEAAEREGRLVVYSNTDTFAAGQLLSVCPERC